MGAASTADSEPVGSILEFVGILARVSERPVTGVLDELG